MPQLVAFYSSSMRSTHWPTTRPVTQNPLYYPRISNKPMLPFLHLGPLTIPIFGLMVACAMLSAYFVLRADLARRGIAPKDSGEAESLIAWPCLAGIVGAKLYHVLETPSDLIADPAGVLLSAYGFAWFGGLIAGFTAFALVAIRIQRRASHSANSDVAAKTSPFSTFSTPALRSCSRLRHRTHRLLPVRRRRLRHPTTLPWGVSFPHGLVPTTDRVHPTPIYELIVAVAIAWFLWNLGAASIQSAQAASAPASDSSSKSNRALAPGQVFAAYLVLTGVARFLVEFIRINPRSFLGMSNAQAAAAASIIVGTILWFYFRSRKLQSFAHRA